MGIDENLQDSIRRKLEGFLTADEAEAVMTELNAPSVDEQFAALHAMLVARFDQIDARFDGVDKRFEGVDERFDRIEARLDDHDRRFTQIDAQLLQLDVRTEATAAAVSRLEDEGHRLVGRVDANNERIDKLAFWLMWALVAVFSSILVGIGLSVAIAAGGG